MTRPTRLIRQYPRPEAGGLNYDNTTSGLDAETVQDAIDELAAESGAISVTDGTTTVDPTTTIDFDPTYFAVTDGTGGVAEVTFTGDPAGYPRPLMAFDPDLDMWFVVVDLDGTAVMVTGGP